MRPFGRPVVISGLGMTPMERRGDSSARTLAVTACRLAARDAGVEPAQIDGLLIAHSPVVSCEQVGVHLQHVLGLKDLRLLQDLHAEGSSSAQLIQVAALYVGAGLADTVLCVFADAMIEEGASSGDKFAVEVPRGELPGWEAAHGLFGAPAAYGLAARRHMARYGTTHEHLGAVATAARQWAAGNPLAVARTPLTMADYLAAPMIVDPFRKFDCAFPVNGGIAVVVSAAERAPGRRPPVYVSGIGQGHRGAQRTDGEIHTGAARAIAQALRSAGLALADVDVAQFYDCFSYVTLVTLEDAGFCAKGEGGAFVADGNIAPGGSIPTNTGGGQLSGYYMQGMTPISEAVIQLRADGGARQVEGAEVALVSCHGGILDYYATLVLTSEDPHAR